ncbi:MAG TPA: hypothetical protein VFV87_02135 [Pirellulaceae bacterium]|nr:hypothetical protein [Pirellulaceae bacterium]
MRASVAAELDTCSAREISPSRSAWLFAGAAAGVIGLSCALAGFAPLGFSIAAVFLFAGPHNWLEARYMLTRMPARWGPLAPYFLTGIGGVLLLTGSFALLPWIGGGLSGSGWNNLLATWNTLLIGWIVTLALLRSRQNPRRDWTWLVPIGLTLVALNWLWPFALSLALVYLHPLLALWFLDREIGRMQPAWRTAYRGCLLLVPACLALLWGNLAYSPNLPGDDVLTSQITSHAGGGILNGISTHLLVATHVFLEMLHYGVWIVAIPLISVRMAPWKLDNVPLARRSGFWRTAVIGAIATGAIVMLLLWGAFLADYPLTRNVYFTVAMLHVLAEVPFLLRLL